MGAIRPASLSDRLKTSKLDPMKMAYPIELQAPDISAYATSNCGVPYYTTFESWQPGPHVLINALTHGNELCGAIALDRLFAMGIRPVKGRLTLGFANVAAYRTFDPQRPIASRYLDEDLNRVWSADVLDGPRQSRELDRAREIRPLIDTVDLLLDIHSMQDPGKPLMLAGPTDKGLKLARKVGTPAHIVRDSGHMAGPRLRDYGGFSDPEAPHNALLVECGQHWAASSAQVATDVALRFLVAVGLIRRGDVLDRLTGRPSRQRIIEVTDTITIETEDFRLARPFAGLEVVARAGTPIAFEGGRTVRSPYDHCVLIMPSRRLVKGQTAVRLGRFVSGA
jgi:predicted deacylase